MNRRHVAALAVVVVLGGSAVVTAGTLGAPGVFGGAPATETPGETPTPTPSGSSDRAHVGPADGTLTVRAARNQSIYGDTALPGGTEVVVRVVSNGDRPFLVSKPTTVGADGSFDELFDLGNADPGSSLRVVVAHDGRVLANDTVAVAGSESEAGGPSPEAAVSFDAARTDLRSASEQVVAGTADLEPGTVLVVRLRSTGGNSPFVLPAETTVRSDGSFRATFDLSEQQREADIRVTVHVRENDTDDTERDGTDGDDDSDDSGDGDGGTANATIDYAGDVLTLHNASGQVVRGTTDLPVGTNVTVRLRGGGSQPFLLQRPVTVGRNGSFRATFNLSRLVPSDDVRAVVLRDGEQLVEVPVEIVTVSGNATADVAATPAEVAGGGATAAALADR